MNNTSIASTTILTIIFCGLISLFFSGCGEMYLGVRRVDVYQSSQRMYHRPTPWKCYFVNCPEVSDHVDENQGS